MYRNRPNNITKSYEENENEMYNKGKTITI